MAMTPDEIMRLKVARGWKPAPEPELVPGQEEPAKPVNREDAAIAAALASRAAEMGLRAEDMTDAQAARIVANMPKAEPKPKVELAPEPEPEAEPKPKAKASKKKGKR